MGTPLRPSKAPALPLLLSLLCLLLSLAVGVRGQTCGFSQVDNDNCVCSDGYECALPDPTITIAESCSTARICTASTTAQAPTPAPPTDACGYSAVTQAFCRCQEGFQCALPDPSITIAGSCSTARICTASTTAPTPTLAPPTGICGFSAVSQNFCRCKEGFQCALPDANATIAGSCGTARICRSSPAAPGPTPPPADSCGYSSASQNFCRCRAGFQCLLPDPTATIAESCSTARICKSNSTTASGPTPPPTDVCGYSILSQNFCACKAGLQCTLTDTSQKFAGACASLQGICSSNASSPSSSTDSPPPASGDLTPPSPTTPSLAPLPDAASPPPSLSPSADTPPPLSLSDLPPSSTDSPITGDTPPTSRGLGSPPPAAASSNVCGYSIPDESYCKCPDSYKCGLSSSTERIPGLCTSVKCTKSKCFAGSMTVTVEGRGRKTMSELAVGDRVMVVQSDGSVAYERVFAFSHRAAAEEMVTVALETKKGFSVEASLGHYLLTGDARARTAMRDVRVGDVVWVESADGGARLEADVVVARETRTAVGAYAPHTASGSIVVGGVAASCYTEHIAPHVAEMLLLPVRMLSGVLGDWAAHAANDAVLKLVAKA